MTKQEIGGLLDEIDKFKNNIKECDAVLRTLREIQLNYASAVEQPKEILKKLDALIDGMTKQFCKAEEKYEELLGKSNVHAETLQNVTRESIDTLIQETKGTCDSLLSECKILRQSLETDKNAFLMRANDLFAKIETLSECLRTMPDEVIGKMKVLQDIHEKKIDKLSKFVVGGFIGTTISLILLVISFII